MMERVSNQSGARGGPDDIVGGFDVHRKQITFDYVDTDTGEVRSGQIRPAHAERCAVAG